MRCSNSISRPRFCVLRRLLLVALGLAGVFCPPPVSSNEFKVYWNIPTFQCRPFRLPEIDVRQKYGIVQNGANNFRGEHISILYDPGLFPALFTNATSQQTIRRNGGVPQAGNLSAHLGRFERDLHELVPDPLNAGLAIIDFESWRPIFRQNFGSLEPYKKLSYQLLREQQSASGNRSAAENESNQLRLLSEKLVQTEAARQFEEAARHFMLETLRLARRLRPHAQWGYYGLPFCFNERKETCAAYIRDENDTSGWLFAAAQNLYPSVYWTEKFAADNRLGMVRGRVAEALRMAERPGQKVLVYHRYVYADTRRYLNMSETKAIFAAIKQSGADGIVLWGASGDLGSRSKCESMHEYVLDVLGPAAAAVIEPPEMGNTGKTGGKLGGGWAPLLIVLTLLGIFWTA